MQALATAKLLADHVSSPRLLHRSNLPVVSEVAKSLLFAPELHALAKRIVDVLTEGGTQPFNGLHLRVEKDARDWATIMGGQQVVWSGYISTMRGVGFNSTTRIYVASGMLTYGASGALWSEGRHGARAGWVCSCSCLSRLCLSP